MRNRRNPQPAPPLTRDDVDAAPGWIAALRNVAGFALIASISLGAAWGVRRYLMTSPRFSLEQVLVEGQRTRTKEELMQRARLEMGQNVFRIDLEAARTAMLGDPYVQSATLTRRLPDTLFVHVDERVPVAVVVVGADAFLVTRDGITFKKLGLGDPSDLPVITGIGEELAGSDRDAFADRVRRALEAALEYEQSPLGSKLPVQEIHYEGDAVTLSVGTQGQGVVSLVLGRAPWRRKFEEAARVVAELERRGQKPDVIMLDQSARPERVVARVR